MDLVDHWNNGRAAVEDLVRTGAPKAEIYLRVAQMITDCNSIITLEDTTEILLYDDLTGIYSPNKPEILRQIFHIYSLFKTADIQEILAKIQVLTFLPRIELNPARYLGLQNKTFDFDQRTVIDHSPEQYLTRTLPVRYRKNAGCPLIKIFLEQVIRKEDLELIYDVLTYCLVPGYPYHKAFMLIGSGANGKSTFLQIIERFLGGDNISHIPLQGFERQFSTNRLFGRLANIAADLPSKPVRHTGIFKQLTGGDTIWADIKYHKSGISFINSAKMFFSMNKPPAFLYDDSDAVWRRIIIINFPNTFEGEEADRHIIDKITTPQELSGLLNFCLGRLQSFHDRGGFADHTPETREQYIHLSNSVQAFAEDMLIEDLDSELNHEEIYANYILYCRERKLEVKSKGTLTKRLPVYCPAAERRRSGNDFFWRGIQWRK